MISRIIEYYRKIVKLESRKELTIQNYYSYQINYKEDSNNRILLVDLSQDETFLLQYNQNPNVQYPQNLFVGISVLFGDESYKLFSSIIEYADLNQNVDGNLLTFKISNFELNIAELERMEISLSDSQICEINRVIREQSTIEAIELAINEFFRGDVTVENKIYLALCSNSRALSQIYSELRSERLRNAIMSNSFAKEFITNSPFLNKIDSVDEDSLIRVTDLDEYQQKAIKFAFENRISVITGPPGTGKTQVILNLLANALIRNKKVLVVSKNNKAVENVKDRYDALDEYHYLLRFGTQNLIEHSTVPEIDRLLNSRNMEYYGNDFVMLQNEYESLSSQMRLAKGDLIRMVHWEERIGEYEQEINEINGRIKELEEERDNALKELSSNNPREESLCNLEISGYLSDLRQLDNLIQEKFCGVFGFLYNIFCTKKYAGILFNKIGQYPKDLREYVKADLNYPSVKDTKNGDCLLNTIESVCNSLNRILSYNNEKNRMKSANSTEINGLINERHLKELELISIRREYNELREKEDGLRNRITLAKIRIKGMGMPLVNAFTAGNINSCNPNDIVAYREYLPGGFKYDNGLNNLTMSFLNAFKLNCVTSLSVKNSFPLIPEIFDMIIVDEASQCDIATIIPMVARTKQLVVIGDPQQLKHISNITNDEEQEIKESLGLGEVGFLSYVRSSLWDYCSRLINQTTNGMKTPFRLNNHYRCHSEIIGFSNVVFYGHDGPLSICTHIENEAMGMGMRWINVEGTQVNENTRINEAEAHKCVEKAIATIKKYQDKSVGIITPFRQQAEYIYKIVKEMGLSDKITVSTVHKYQGDEKDVIILSLVVTNNTPDGTLRWIDEYNKHLINVAVTRAKRVLCIIGNKEYIIGNSRGVLRRLVEYVNNLHH